MVSGSNLKHPTVRGGSDVVSEMETYMQGQAEAAGSLASDSVGGTLHQQRGEGPASLC